MIVAPIPCDVGLYVTLEVGGEEADVYISQPLMHGDYDYRSCSSANLKYQGLIELFCWEGEVNGTSDACEPRVCPAYMAVSVTLGAVTTGVMPTAEIPHEGSEERRCFEVSSLYRGLFNLTCVFGEILIDTSGCFTQWEPMPAAPWQARSRASAVQLSSGDVLLLGGVGNPGCLQEAWLWTPTYDGTTGSWQELTRPPWSGRFGLAAVRQITEADGEQVTIIGGNDGLRDRKDVWRWVGGSHLNTIPLEDGYKVGTQREECHYDQLNESNQSAFNESNQSTNDDQFNESNQSTDDEQFNESNQSTDDDLFNESNQSTGYDQFNESNQSTNDEQFNESNQSTDDDQFNESNESTDDDQVNESNQSTDDDQVNESNQSTDDDLFNESNQSTDDDQVNKSNQSTDDEQVNESNQSTDDDQVNESNQSTDDEQFNGSNQSTDDDQFNESNQSTDDDHVNESNQSTDDDQVNESNQSSDDDQFNESNQSTFNESTQSTTGSDHLSVQPLHCSATSGFIGRRWDIAGYFSQSLAVHVRLLYELGRGLEPDEDGNVTNGKALIAVQLGKTRLEFMAIDTQWYWTLPADGLGPRPLGPEFAAKPFEWQDISIYINRTLGVVTFSADGELLTPFTAEDGVPFATPPDTAANVCSASLNVSASDSCVEVAPGYELVLVELAVWPTSHLYIESLAVTSPPGSWQQLVDEAPFPPRSSHAAVGLPGGDILVVGGISNGQKLNDVWRWSPSRCDDLTDVSSLEAARYELACNMPCVDSWPNGQWRQLPDAPFVGRLGHAMLWTAGGLLLSGGRSAVGVMGDVWRWTTSGERCTAEWQGTWEQLASVAPWPTRYFHGMVGFPPPDLPGGEPETVLLVGGFGGEPPPPEVRREPPEYPQQDRNDIWCGSLLLGNFAEWHAVAPMAPFSDRSMSAVVAAPAFGQYAFLHMSGYDVNSRHQNTFYRWVGDDVTRFCQAET